MRLNLPSCSFEPSCWCGQSAPSPSVSHHPPQSRSEGRGRRPQAKTPGGTTQLTGPHTASYDTKNKCTLCVHNTYTPTLVHTWIHFLNGISGTKINVKWTQKYNLFRHTNFGYLRSLGAQPLVAVWDQCNQFIHLIYQGSDNKPFNLLISVSP